MPPDLSSLSVEDLLAMKQQAAPQAAAPVAVATPSPTSGLESLSTEELLQLKNSSVNQDWNVGGMLKNFGAGVVEGVAGMGGLLMDFAPAVNPITMFNRNPITGLTNLESAFQFPVSKKISEELSPILPEKDPQYRYARTAGNFAAPVPIKGANSLRSLLTGVFSGFGAQGAEDITGDTKIAPLVGAIGTGAGVSALTDLGALLKRVFVGANSDEIAGSAAKAFGQATGLSTDDLATANMGPRNLLEDLQTTAERTGNAGAAQLEKTLAATGDNAIDYAKLAAQRDAAREGVIGGASQIAAVNPEGLGSTLINTAENVQGKMIKNSSAFWDEFPRNTPIEIGPEQSAIAGILSNKQGGLGLKSEARVLIDQFLERPVQTSGRLQDIREDVLKTIRDKQLTSLEQRALGALQGKIDEALSRGLEGSDYQLWQAARQSTAAEKQAFGRGTAGGYLVSDNARTSTVLDKVFKGDKQAVTEIKAAIGQDPQILEQVKRGVLDMIGRDAKGQLTPSKMKKFLDQNNTGLQELFGKDHYTQLKRVYEDLASQAGVNDLAFLASKGNSVTAQRNTVAGALQDVITESLVPGTSGPLSGVINAIKEGAGIKDRKAVEELLFKAALDPNFAEQLSKAPTTKRIKTALESLQDAGANIVSSGSLATVKELSRTQDNRSPLARLLERVTADRVLAEKGGQQSKQASQTGTPQALLGKVLQQPQPLQKSEQPTALDQSSVVENPSIQPTATPNAIQQLLSKIIPEANAMDDMKAPQVEEITDFGTKVDKIAANLDAKPEHLLAVMNFETGGTLSPSVKNKAGSGATGLIQFMPATAQELTGADTKEAAIRLLASMSPVEQLDYVEKHLAPFKGKLKTLEDVYMAVLYPRAVGKDNDYALFKEGTKAYWQNRGLDLDGDGTVTKAEATAKVRNYNNKVTKV